jgi:hypothetical protein
MCEQHFVMVKDTKVSHLKTTTPSGGSARSAAARGSKVEGAKAVACDTQRPTNNHLFTDIFGTDVLLKEVRGETLIEWGTERFAGRFWSSVSEKNFLPTPRSRW